MFTVTRFCVQGFQRRGAALVPAEAHEFMDEGRARDAAAVLSRLGVGAALYSVTGEPGSNLWREPRLLKTYGEVPELAA